MDTFQPKSLPVLIGSLPMDDHDAALKLVMAHTPDIPLWVQLPVYKAEGMIAQFLPGFPGLEMEKDRTFINSASETFSDDVLKFYEDYMSVLDGDIDLSNSRFVLTDDTAKGFSVYREYILTLPKPPQALKGQITGPITFGTGVSDDKGRAIFYDAQLRDVAVKLLALKARWQVQQLSCFDCPVMVFFDEPALAGFGSSAYISISRDEVADCFEEVIDAVHAEGGLAGIHVCANVDWSLILESSVDIISFDAYAYFDRFILYPDAIKKFIKSGGILAWGIVPTKNAEEIENETVDSLVTQWKDKARKVEALGLDKSTVHAQSLISPSCGTGSINLELATRVLQLTGEVSQQLRKLH
jgi:hypothetical protein